MADRTTSYAVEGHYLLRGVQERQVGNLTSVNDWLLYGAINDCKANGSESPKKVMGMRFKNDGALGLLKLPCDVSLCPILWYLRPTGHPSPRDLLSGTYDGVWGTAKEVYRVKELQEIYARRGAIILRDLQGLTPEGLEKVVFKRDALKRMEEAARDAEQVGRMQLSRLV